MPVPAALALIFAAGLAAGVWLEMRWRRHARNRAQRRRHDHDDHFDDGFDGLS